MSELKGLLHRAEASAPRTELDLGDLRRRRDRRHRARRIEAIVVGLAIATVSLGSAFLAFRQPAHEGTAADGGRTVLPPATSPPLVAGLGEYYYWRVHSLGGCVAGACLSAAVDHTELRATYWWSADDSGRVAVDTAHNYGIDAGTF